MEVPPVTQDPIPATMPPEVAPQGNGQEPPKEAPKEPPKDEEVSSKFAALAKKDKIVSKKAQELAAQERALKEREAKVKAWEEKEARLKKLAQEDPKSAAEELGLAYDRWTQQILNKEGELSPTDQIKLLQKRLDEIETKRNEEKTQAQKDREEAAKKQNEQLIADYKDTLEEFVNTNAEKFELLKALNERKLVVVKDLLFQGIQMVHQETGKIPSNEEAAEGVQKYFINEIENLIQNVKYFKDKYGAKEAEKEPVVTPDGSVPTTTLTNSMSPGIGNNLPAVTEEDRIRRAIKAMEAAS